MKHILQSAIVGARNCGIGLIGLGIAGIAGGLLLGGPALLGIGASLCITGGCTVAGAYGASLLTGGMALGEPVHKPAYFLGLAATALCLYAYAGPGHGITPSKFASNAKTLTGQFEHAAKKIAREVDRHVIWPDIKPAHGRRPTP